MKYKPYRNMDKIIIDPYEMMFFVDLVEVCGFLDKNILLHIIGKCP